jgi:hypothetical protein
VNLVEKNVVGWVHVLISVNTCVSMCAFWRGVWQGGVIA